jgi:hypothetical protein
MNVQLQSGYLSEAEGQEVSDSVLEKNAVLVYPGKFQSMDGEVEVTHEQLSAMVANHNSIFEKFKRLTLGEVPLRDMPPIQLDHEPKATHTVGRLVGPLSMGEIDIEGEKKPAVLGKVRILGKENVEKVKDGRWIHLSIGADLEDGKLNELTITPFPAAQHAAMLAKNVAGDKPQDPEKEGMPAILAKTVVQSDPALGGQILKDEKGNYYFKVTGGAGIEIELESKNLLDARKEVKQALKDTEFSKGGIMGLFGKNKKLAEGEEKKDVDMSYSCIKEKMEMYAKCKKKMMAEGKSDEDAEKELSALADEDVQKMAAEQDESDKKMASESEEKEKMKMSKLAKAKDMDTKLSAQLEGIKLAQVRTQLVVKLSALRAAGKLTPAEYKKLNIDEMSKLSAEARSAALKTYESRQPVIDPNSYGSAKAESIEAIRTRLSSEIMEKEAASNMPSVAKSPTRMAAGMDDNTASIREQVEQIQGPNPKENMSYKHLMAKHLGDLEIIHHAMSEGRHDEAMKQLSDHISKIKAMDSGDMDGHMDEKEADKHLSALADAEKSLENTLIEAKKLMSELIA